MKAHKTNVAKYESTGGKVLFLSRAESTSGLIAQDELFRALGKNPKDSDGTEYVRVGDERGRASMSLLELLVCADLEDLAAIALKIDCVEELGVCQMLLLIGSAQHRETAIVEYRECKADLLQEVKDRMGTAPLSETQKDTKIATKDRIQQALADVPKEQAEQTAVDAPDGETITITVRRKTLQFLFAGGNHSGLQYPMADGMALDVIEHAAWCSALVAADNEGNEQHHYLSQQLRCALELIEAVRRAEEAEVLS